jgi:hypothetical protein
MNVSLRAFVRGMLVSATLILSVTSFAKPPIQYPDPPGSGGSGGGSGCSNDTSAAGCSHTYKQSSQLQVWCGQSRGWVYIKSESCFYESTRNSACCTYQNQVCSYTNSSGFTENVQETLANQQTCSTQ